MCGIFTQSVVVVTQGVSGSFIHPRLRKNNSTMPIELRTQRDGSLREHWYGRYEVNGRRHYVNLGVKVSGTPPASLSIRDVGDAAFERSRTTAQLKLDSILGQVHSQQTAERLVEQIYEIKTGERLKSVKLVGLAEEWLKIPRRRKPSARYAAQCQSTLRRFQEFVSKENSNADELAHVTRSVARSFMDAEARIISESQPLMCSSSLSPSPCARFCSVI